MKNNLVILLPFLLVAMVWGGLEYGRRLHTRPPLQNALTEFTDLCLKNVDRNDHGQVFQTLRHCVHNNTEYAEGDERNWNAKHLPETVRKMTRFLEKKIADAPHAECDLQATLFKNSLQFLGYDDVQTVILIAMTDRFHDHVVLDVLNPSTGKREIHDPLFNIHYVEKETHTLLGIEDLLTMNLEDVNPCIDPQQCGWETNNTRHGILPSKMRKTLSAAAIKRTDSKYRHLIYNAQRFDPFEERTYKRKTRSYCKKQKKHCKNPVLNLLKTPQ